MFWDSTGKMLKVPVMKTVFDIVLNIIPQQTGLNILQMTCRAHCVRLRCEGYFSIWFNLWHAIFSAKLFYTPLLLLQNTSIFSKSAQFYFPHNRLTLIMIICVFSSLRIQFSCVPNAITPPTANCNSAGMNSVDK